MSLRLSPTTCYDAVTRDDPAFDGVFYTAVLTTGIYCRPICKAQTPRRENVRFFATAAAAADAGFRPCLKCRPELAPDAPVHQALSPLTARALRLIGRGVLDEAGVGELARRLNLSTRQLRRIFLDEIGAPPVAVAQTRRLLFAKKLIDETDLPMTDIAFSAGFGSVRRFNDTIRKTYSRTPTEIRKLRGRSKPDPDKPDIELKLPYREPFNWPAMFAVLRAGAIPRVELVGMDSYRRTLRIGDATGSIEVTPLPEEHAVTLRVDARFSRYLLPITEAVKNIFDLRADPATIASCLAGDPLLAAHVRAHAGTRLPGSWDGFELVVRAILDRHPTLPGAYLAAALVDRIGDEAPETDNPTLSHLFPTPGQLVETDLTNIGLTSEQCDGLRSVARAVDDGRLAFDGSQPADAVIERLAATSGLDAASVHLVIMRSLGEPDMFHPGLVAEVAAPSQPDAWRPWRTYGVMCLQAAAAAEQETLVAT